jgi:transmembrane sensor
MNKNNRFIQIARYITGECSEIEKVEFEKRMEQDPDLKNEVHGLQAVWNTKKKHNIDWDVDSAWKRFNQEINRKENIHSNSGRYNRKKNNLRLSGLNWVFRVAAIFTIIGFVSVFMYLSIDESSGLEQIGLSEATTERGQRIQMQLDDGTKVYLNSASRIKYPEVFDQDSRFVELTGEAYFDVNSDERPFFVYAGDVTIEIIGTEFNVRAYSDENIEVVVADGLVGVKLNNSDETEQVVLSRGNMAQLVPQQRNELSIYQQVDMDTHLGWMAYRMTFENHIMSQISRELERWYGVDIEFSEPEINELRVSATFEDESLQEVLRVLSLALNLEYEISGRSVLMYKN